MQSKTITSLKHPFIKYCVKLKEDRAFRYREKKVILFGTKILSELPSSSIKVLLETYLHASGLKSDETYIVTEDIIEKIYGAGAPEPLAAIVDMPQPKDLSSAPRLLILDSISDPGNLGTLFRTALALGAGGVFLLGNCCDPFNDKALRAAKGATFRLPFDRGDSAKLQSILSAKKRTVYIADMAGKGYTTAERGEDTALILSSEAHGAKDVYKKMFTPLSIPMSKEMESLNVAIAGAIILSHLWGKQ